jgi:Flp pilus assembly protein TadD
LRERAKLLFVFSSGKLGFAASNIRAHRMLESLVRWNAFKPNDLPSISTDLADSELLKQLISSGLCDTVRATEYLMRQTVDILRPALLWTEGEWRFDPKTRLAQTYFELELEPTLAEAARRLPTDFVARRLFNANEILTPAAFDWSSAELTPAEAFVISRIDAPRRIHEIGAVSGMGGEATLQVIYSLLIGGFIIRERWPSSFGEEIISIARRGDGPDLKVISPAGTLKRQVPVSTGNKTGSEMAEASRKELGTLFARLADANTHYEVLDVGRAADQGEIKQVYIRMAKRFHPDRFHHEKDPALLSQLESAFARIAQAYECLRDPSQRAAYDARLSGQRNSQARNSDVTSSSSGKGHAGRHSIADEQSKNHSESILAEENFEHGMLALRTGNGALAVSSFAEAARLSPNVAKYRAFLGRALTAAPQTRRQAEAELQTALKLDPRNVEYRIMLAELYLIIGLQNRAQTELDHVLALDPGNQKAAAAKARLRVGTRGSQAT